MNLLPILLLLAHEAGADPDANGADADATSSAGTNEARLEWAQVSQRLAQMTIEQRVIIRVPMARPAMPAPAAERFARPVAPGAEEDPPVESWKERKGPKCIDIRSVRAAAITSSRGVDLLLRNRDRLRVLLGRECRQADLYSGFYIQPNEDGALCVDRDRVLARSGADCLITDIKRLVPER